MGGKAAGLDCWAAGMRGGGRGHGAAREQGWRAGGGKLEAGKSGGWERGHRAKGPAPACPCVWRDAPHALALCCTVLCCAADCPSSLTTLRGWRTYTFSCRYYALFPLLPYPKRGLPAALFNAACCRRCLARLPIYLVLWMSLGGKSSLLLWPGPQNLLGSWGDALRPAAPCYTAPCRARTGSWWQRRGGSWGWRAPTSRTLTSSWYDTGFAPAPCRNARC